MRYFIALVTALTLAACSTSGSEKLAPAKPKAPLDNKTFTTQLVRNGQSEPAQLVFKDGMFHSTAGDTYGFSKASYTAVKEGEFTMFEAVTTSEKNGKMIWKGRVQGNTIHGTAVWDRAWWQADREYTFSGKRK